MSFNFINYNNIYAIQVSKFPISIFWVSGILSLSDSKLIISGGNEEYVIPDNQLESLERHTPIIRTDINIRFTYKST